MRNYLCCLFLLLGLTSAVSPAQAAKFKLANGDEITGELVEWAVDYVVIEHPQLGTMRLGLDQLEVDTGKPPNPGWFGTNFLRGWTRRVDVGMNGEQGDSRSVNITVGSRFGYDDDWTRWSFNARYFFNNSDDGDNDNNATVSLGRDWLIPDSRWYGSLFSRYQFDQFQAWENRITLTGGPGLHLYKSERQKLDVVLGPAFTRDFGEVRSSRGEAALSFTYEFKISERQSFDVYNQFFVEFAPNGGDYRNFTTADWSVRLTERPVLSLNVGIQNEYESNPDDDDDNNDLKYFLTLGVDL